MLRESNGGADRRVQLMSIYLNDHLAGATAGVELIRRMEKSAPDALRPTLSRLGTEIAQDRRELLTVMSSLGLPVRRYKIYAGWLAEKAGRLKPNGSLTRRSPLSTLLELEMLRTGVQGKAGMWEVLRSSSSGHSLDASRLDELQARARQQLDAIAELHRQTGRDVFGS